MVERIVICRSNPIDPDPRVEKIARSLINSGYQVQAVGWDRTGMLKKEQLLSGFGIYRIQVRARYGTGLMNLPALLAWQISLLWWLLINRKNINAIHACDFDTVLPALIIKAFWGKMVVYDIFDFYADHLRKTPNFLKKLIRRIDLWAINQADGVIIADDSRIEQIKGSSPKTCITIYNSPDDNPSPKKEKNTSVRSPTLQISYVGLLQAERGLFEILDIISSHPEWHLHLAGFGGDESEIIRKAEKISNVTWYGRISYEDALKISEMADVLFATYDPSIPNHQYSSPNKVFEAMMLGKPIIVAENTNMDKIISKAKCGIVVKYGERVSIENALIRLAEDESLRTAMGKNGRHAYNENYSWPKMQLKLEKLYKHLFKRRHYP